MHTVFPHTFNQRDGSPKVSEDFFEDPKSVCWNNIDSKRSLLYMRSQPQGRC